MDEYFEANRKHWDEVVGLHLETAFYDVQGFKAGRDTLHSIEVEEVGDVREQSLLHLQCHFGMDTLSWARRGATVTGVDFSGQAIQAARELAADVAIDARFVESDIYSLPQNLDGQFDVVVTSYGAIFWLPDVPRWARVVAQFVRRGGVFHMVEFHPIAGVFEANEEGAIVPRLPYFPGAPLLMDEDGTYADRAAKLQNGVTCTWAHPISEVVSSLIDAGLRIEFLHEFAFSVEQWNPWMKRGDDGYWRLRKHAESFPMMYSIRARKPEHGDV